MQPLPILVALLLGGVALLYVVYPLLRSATGKPQPLIAHGPTASAASAQTEREQEARTALQEIELDFQLGNLAEPDYRSLRERYLRRAFLAMKFRQSREHELDELIEEQLRQMKENDENSIK